MPRDKTEKSQDDESSALALPAIGFPSLLEDILGQFDSWIQPFSSRASQWGRQPFVDIQDRGDRFVLTAELPGFERKDVEVTVSPGSLEMRAERQTEATKGRQEPSSSSYFYQRLQLPDDVVAKDVSGTMKNGILELSLPKKERRERIPSRRVDLK